LKADQHRRRLKEHKDTVKLFIITADFITHNYPIVTEVEGLPYDCFSVIPCSTFPGGVIILSTNAIIHVGQSSRKVILPVNGWFARVSDVQTIFPTPEEGTRDLQLEGSLVSFVDDTNFLVVLGDGAMIPVEIVAEGKTVSALKMGAPRAQTTLPSTVAKGPDGYVFIGSTSGPSVLVKADRVEEEVPEEEVGDQPVGVVNSAATMDVDDDGPWFLFTLNDPSSSLYRRYLRPLDDRPRANLQRRRCRKEAPRY
jgi:cleavage and polyadenylation specificity factor subunit 1